MPPQLLALNEGPNILLDKPILLLGRHQECDIQLASRKVSRRHCCIAQVEDHLVVRDLGSTNGLRVNGVRVLEGKLKPGDELMIGTYRYRVQWDTVAPPPAPRAARAEAPRDHEPPSPPPARVAADASPESGDIPVPISEPPAKAKTQLAGPAAAPNHEDRGPPTERSPSSLVLPDDIRLAPPSDNLPSAPDRSGSSR